MENKKEIITLAILIAILPPIWAVASPYLGNTVGPIALITAGIYVTNGNRFEDAHRIAAGFIAGDVWALISAVIMAKSPFNADLTLFCTLAVMGFLAVVISARLPKVFYTASWLAGWAIGMLTMNLNTEVSLIGIALQIGASMLVGVYYVGALLDLIHKRLIK